MKGRTKIFNPKQPQKAKRIETAGKIFNPKQPQRGKRIEREKEALNPKWLQKAKWIKTLVHAWEKYALPGAGACVCRNDGSLPALRLHPPLAGKTEVKFSFWLQFFFQPLQLPARGCDQAGAGACTFLTDGCLPCRWLCFNQKSLRGQK